MKYKEFRVGQKIIITHNPTMWNSFLNGNCPIGQICPYHTTILEIKKHVSGSYAMTDGEYGWDLTTLINENCIINIRHVRKMKLKEILKI